MDSAGVVDEAVTQAPTVTLLDGSNRARTGVRVTFRVVAGVGSLRDSVVTTDASGRASVGSWTLGPTETTNIVEASADGASSVRFTVPARWPRRLATGGLSACAVVTNNAYCWGDNSQSELATTSGGTFSPTPQTSLVTGVGTPAEVFGTSGGHLCMKNTIQASYCWGRNDFGQAGATRFVAAGVGASVITGFRWRMLSPGRLSTCAVDSVGSGYCWGANQRGEVGNPATLMGTTPNNTPTLVIATTKFKSIAAGWQHSCGIATDDSVSCWGANLEGQLGLGRLDSTSRSPASISTTERFSMISASGRHTCGLTVDGRAFCWGQNAYGQLGDGTTTLRSVPTAVAGGLRFTFIVTGALFNAPLPAGAPTPPTPASAAFTCALTESGAAYCWGWNGWGQLGDGTVQDQLVPTAVAGNLRFNGLAAGETFACGIRGTTASCWGSNHLGQLGDGTTTRRLAPTRVALP